MKRASQPTRQSSQTKKAKKIKPFIPENIYPTDKHKPGSVLRVTLTNFLTYDNVTVYPGPHLNVLIGPNGSGKSTIVCALCLGLGGSPKLLGRAKDTVAFIKHGTNHAQIEIELKGKEIRNVTITRDIHRGQSDLWKINGKPANKENVVTVVKALNIQIDNLCQFLPQDRVVSFAQLNPCDLLKETQKAVGGQLMLDQHLTLIRSKKAIMQNELTLTTQKKDLDELKQKNQDLEEEVRQFQKKQQIEEEAALLKKKRPWVEFEAQRQIALQAQQVAKEATKAYEELHKEMAPLQQELARQKTHLTTLENKLEKDRAQIKALEAQRKNRLEKMERSDNSIEQIQQDILALKDRAAERKKRLDKIDQQIGYFMKELEGCMSPQAIKEAQAATDAKMRTLEEKIRQEQTARENVEEKVREFENEIKEKMMQLHNLHDSKRQKLNMMQRAAPDLHQTYMWYTHNKQLFEKEVMFPFLEMSVAHEQHARYLEMQLGKNMWIVLALTDKDRTTIAQQTDMKGWKVVCIRLPKADTAIQHPFDLTPLKAHGVTHYLDQLLEAPPIIKKVMVDMAQLNTCVAGTIKTEQNLNQVLRNGIAVYTPKSVHLQNQSRYGNKEKTLRSVPLRMDPVKLVGGVDDKLQKKLEDDLAQLKEEILPWKAKQKQAGEVERDLTHRMDELRREKTALQKEGIKKAGIQKRIEPLRVEREATSTEENIEAEEEEMRGKIRQITMQKLSFCKDMLSAIREMTKHSLSTDVLAVKRIQARAILQAQETQMHHKTQQLKQLEQEANKKKAILHDMKAKCKHLLDIAQAGGALDEQMKEDFAPLPNTLDEIDTAIADCNRRADALFIANPKVIHDYETRKRQIHQLQDTVDKLQANIGADMTKVEEIQAPWLNKLEQLTEKIGRKFSDYMDNIGCAGEVRIHREEDYDKWGMQILVKFREKEPLAVLDSHHQSGGERSVATMLYLISLHDLTQCPFRVVDEINQGMDPVNERMIFQEVVNAACRPGLPQYFLITPKLLTNLKYSQGVTVLCVFNGPWLMPSFDSINCEGKPSDNQKELQNGNHEEEEDDED